MIPLYEGMLLYHGSYTEVPIIDLSKCRTGKDFGKGFYLTPSREQAHRFIPISVRKNTRVQHAPTSCDGYVSVFRVVSTAGLAVHYFPEANEKWLHLVAFYRSMDESSSALLQPEERMQYQNADIIAGKIANDQTARTINTYMDGLLGGPPGTDLADRTAIAMLIPERLEDQYCFRTAAAIANLEFIRSEAYEPL